MKLKLLILLMVIFLSIGDIGENNSTTYRSLVDRYKGFFRIVNTNTGGSMPYDNHIFNVNIRDKIVWVNDDSYDTLTIKCGKENRIGSNYCAKCGESLKN